MILVTGATGFIGEQLVRTLLEQGEQVRILVRSPEKAKALFGPLADSLEIAQGDLSDPTSLATAVAGVQRVYHCAAVVRFHGDWDKFFRTNVEGTRHLFQACLAAGVQRVVHMSSIAAGGPAIIMTGGALRPRTEADLPSPLPGCPYGSSKLAQEQTALSFNEGGLPVIVVRPSAVFGPGDRSGINTLLRMVGRRQMPFYLGSRHGQVNVVYIRDVVRGSMAAMERGRPGQVYHLVGPHMTHVELLGLLAQVSGGKAPWFTLPTGVLRTAARLVAGGAKLLGLRRVPLHPNDVQNWTANWFVSGEKAQAELMLEPTDPKGAWTETWSWLAQQ